MIIDTHNHFIPDSLIEEFKRPNNIYNVEVVDKEGDTFIKHKEGFAYPLLKGFYDYETKVYDLEKMKIDKAILSPSPTLFFYWSSIEAAKNASIMCNDWVYQFAQKYPERFIPMGTIPMVDIDSSLEELERIIDKYDMRLIVIGPHINNFNLDEERFYPIYELAEKNNVIISLHPYYIGAKPQFEKYYLTNLMANPLDTTMGLLSLIYGGVFDRYPNLKILAAHGGGFFPYQLGRFNHGFRVRKETKVHIKKEPAQYLENILYDSVTHWEIALEYLIKSMGDERVVIGTDYPFDMGEYDIVEKMERIDIWPIKKKNVYCGNIMKYIM